MTNATRYAASFYFLLTAVVASAQTSTWIGSVDTSWNDAGNWDNGVPNVASEIAVVGSPSPTKGDISVVLGGLTVESAGVLEVGAGLNFNFDPAATVVNSGSIAVASNTDFQVVNVVTNDGTITLDGSGLATDLELVTDSTLMGVGSLVLNGANARINDAGGLQTLTNGASHTIRGVGNVGVGTINLVNEGLIVADTSGDTLTLDPNGNTGTLTNNGALRAIGGGELLLASGVYENAGGMIDSVGGRVSFGSLATVNGGSIAGADVVVGIGLNVEFSGVTFDATVSVGSNTDFGVRGTVTNNGTITLDGSGLVTDLELATDSTLAGIGTLVLDGANARITDAGGLQTLTNGAGHTIRGVGNVGVNTIGLVNDGLIVADVSGRTLTVDPSNSGAAIVTNNGALRATGGGELLLASGEYDNAGGVIESAGGRVSIGSAATINGGAITGADVVVGSGLNVEFSGVTFDATVDVGSNTDFGLRGTVTNNGTITLDGSGAAADVELATDSTLAGSGTLVLNGANARINDAGGLQTLTNGAGHTIRGVGNVGVGTINVVNNGAITADTPGGTLTVNPVSLTNTGALRAENGARIDIPSGELINTGGLIEAIGPTSIVTAASSVDFLFSGGSVRAIDGGTVTVADASSVPFDLRTNDGTLEFTGSAATDLFYDNGLTSITGVQASVAGSLQSAAFSENNGVIRIDGGLDFISIPTASDATNTGTIIAGAGSRFEIGPVGLEEQFDVPVGGTLPPDTIPPIDEFRPFVSTGTLAGAGYIGNAKPGVENGVISEGFLETDGLVTPGEGQFDIATLTLGGRDVILGDNNTLQIEIGAAGADAVVFETFPTTTLSGQTFPALTVDLNGELEIVLTPDYTPTAGDAFTILTATEGFTGVFATETLPTLDDCLLWRVNYNPTSVVLEVILPDFLPGDFNNDGRVDNDDLNLLLANWGSTTVPPEWTNGFTGPAVDNDELNDLLAKWGTGVGTSAVSATTIPEPSAGIFAFAAIGSAWLRRRVVRRD